MTRTSVPSLTSVRNAIARDRAEEIATAVIHEAGTGIGTPGSRYGETIHACAPVIGACAVILEDATGESLEDGAGGWDFTAGLHGIISAVVNDSPEPAETLVDDGPRLGFDPAALLEDWVLEDARETARARWEENRDR